MTRDERRTWLETVSFSQLKTLCYVAGIYKKMEGKGRAHLVLALSLVDGIEVPRRA